jgi:uncharacterized Zn finger protein
MLGYIVCQCEMYFQRDSTPHLHAMLLCCLQVDKLATKDRSAELQARVLLREKEASELRLENRALAKLQREQDRLIARTEGSALAQVNRVIRIHILAQHVRIVL